VIGQFFVHLIKSGRSKILCLPSLTVRVVFVYERQFSLRKLRAVRDVMNLSMLRGERVQNWDNDLASTSSNSLPDRQQITS
jgi:hypothetical protein